jgi:DNA-binding NarL/FixJ family response regulator
MPRVKRADPHPGTELPAPEGLQQTALEVGAEQYLVLRYPLRPWQLPCVLTSAEQEIVLAILAGQTRRDVARARGSSVRTVSNLLAQVFRKLGVRSRIELAERLSTVSWPPRATP